MTHAVRNAAGLFLTRSIKGGTRWGGPAFAYAFTAAQAEKMAAEHGGEVVLVPVWNPTTRAYT